MLHHNCSEAEKDCRRYCYGEYREPHLALLRLRREHYSLSATGACIIFIGRRFTHYVLCSNSCLRNSKKLHRQLSLPIFPCD